MFSNQSRVQHVKHTTLLSLEGEGMCTKYNKNRNEQNYGPTNTRYVKCLRALGDEVGNRVKAFMIVALFHIT